MKLRRKTSYFGPRPWVVKPSQEGVKTTIMLFFARWVAEKAVISRFLAEALQTLNPEPPVQFVLPAHYCEFHNGAIPHPPVFRRTADYALFLVTGHPEWEFYERFSAFHPSIRCIPLYPAERYSLWLPGSRRTLFSEGILLGRAIVEKHRLPEPAEILPCGNSNQMLVSPLTTKILGTKL